VPYYSPAELRERVFDAPLRTTELRVSAPVINRHIAALERGAPAPRIRVGEGTVLEGGLHWYVAALVHGRPLAIEKTDAPPPELIRYSMRQVIFEGLDWDNMTGRRD
jgi:hypothetical protein